MGSQGGDPLGRVDTASPAQGDDQVAGFPAQKIGPPVHLFRGGFGVHPVVDVKSKSGAGQGLSQLVDRTRGFQVVVGYDQDLAAAQEFYPFPGLRHRIHPEQDVAGHPEVISSGQVHARFSR